MADDKQPTAKKTSVAKSTAVWTAALLVVANAAFLAWKPLSKVDPESLPSAHTWVWWATKEFTDLKQTPDVVLLGSSMTMQPFGRVDANLLGHDIDYCRHHRVNYIEQSLQKKGYKADIVYNFALPGGMMSDNYMVMRALLEGKRKPRVAIVSLSMRDMMDCQVHCLGTTPAFRLLSRYTPIDDLVDISMPQIWQRFDYLAQKDIYLWGKKLDLQVMLSEGTKQTLGPKFSKWFAPSRLAEADPTKNMASNLKSDVEFFPVRCNEGVTWNDNTSEYKRRYRNANDKLFATEAIFLQKLYDLARQRNIELMLVNTPLTPQNHALMPAGSYEHYVAYLHDFAKTHDVPLVDLDGQPQFVHEDFYDSAHMNGGGGAKMADAMVNCLTTQPKLVAALRGDSPPAAQQLAASKKQAIK